MKLSKQTTSKKNKEYQLNKSPVNWKLDRMINNLYAANLQPFNIQENYELLIQANLIRNKIHPGRQFDVLRHFERNDYLELTKAYWIIFDYYNINNYI